MQRAPATGNRLIIQQGGLIRRGQRVCFVPVVKTVGDIGGGGVGARHGVRRIKVDAPRVRIEGKGFGYGHNAHLLNWFIVVQAAAEPGRRAFAVVRGCPVPHVVGVLGVAVVKHGVVGPQVGGRQVGKAAGRLNGVVLVQQRIRGCVGEGAGR